MARRDVDEKAATPAEVHVLISQLFDFADILGVDLLEFWLSKQPGAVFYSPPEVIRGLLQWGSRLLDHANYSRLLPQVGGGEVSNPPQYFTTQAK